MAQNMLKIGKVKNWPISHPTVVNVSIKQMSISLPEMLSKAFMDGLRDFF